METWCIGVWSCGVVVEHRWTSDSIVIAGADIIVVGIESVVPVV